MNPKKVEIRLKSLMFDTTLATYTIRFLLRRFREALFSVKLIAISPLISTSAHFPPDSSVSRGYNSVPRPKNMAYPRLAPRRKYKFLKVDWRGDGRRASENLTPPPVNLQR